MKNYAIHQRNLWKSLHCVRSLAEKMKGAIATLPNLITLRMRHPDKNSIWERWFTPLSLIAFGRYEGKKVIIIAHHAGPLATKGRLTTWAESGEKDRNSGREKYGFDGLPQITQKEFNALASGTYGPVAVIDFETYWRKHKKNICGGYLLHDDAKQDPLIAELFGKDKDVFLDVLHQKAIEYTKKRNKIDNAQEKTILLELKDRYGWNLFDETKDEFPHQPVALFLSLDALIRWGNPELSISVSISTIHNLSQSNFVVLNNENADIQAIEFDPRKHWKDAMIITGRPKYYDFFTLIRCGDQLFSEYPKDGNCMDTGEPMYLVTHFEKIGEPTSFTTPLHGSPFLKYHINEVRAIAPEGANAFEICGDIKPGMDAIVPVQFFNVTVDFSKRIPRKKEVVGDLQLLLRLNGIQIKK